MLITIITLAYAIVYSSSAQTIPNILDLSDSNITELGIISQALSEFPQLGNPDVIILDGNDLKTIHENAFRQLFIVELRLAYCNLPKDGWQVPILAVKNTLLKLDLKGNAIGKMDSTTFKGMRLTYLDISGNGFFVVPSAIKNIRNTLEELHLNDNFIQKIPKIGRAHV